MLQPFGVGDSFGFEVKPMGPPRLLSPRNDAEVAEQNPSFTWTRISPSPIEPVTYKLTVTEVLPGQTKDEAMAANPPWFEQGRLAAAQLRYPVSGRRFTGGASYAWQIKAYAGGQFLDQSEVWAFFAGTTRPPSAPPYSWDVLTRRMLHYRLDVEEVAGESTHRKQSDITLEFLGQGNVKVSIAEDSAGQSRTATFEGRMLPTGGLSSSDRALAGFVISRFAFDVLPEREVTRGSSWPRLYPPGEPIARHPADVTACLRMEFSLAGSDSDLLDIGVKGFSRTEPNTGARRLLPEPNRGAAPFEWKQFLQGRVFFNLDAQCTESCELVGTSRPDYVGSRFPETIERAPEKVRISLHRAESSRNHGGVK